MKKIFMICVLSSLFAVSINAMESSSTELDEKTEQDTLMKARISDWEKQVHYLLAEKQKLKQSINQEEARLEMSANEIFVFGAKDGKNITPIKQFALQ